MFRLRLTKDRTTFSSGHFITYDGDSCELLHGHNYRAAVRLESDELGQDAYVLDFAKLKGHTEAICAKLDHRMLVADRNPRLSVTEEDGSVHVRYGSKLYVFPREDVVLLPILNTTCEELARWFTGELIRSLRKALKESKIHTVEVEIEESVGQAALWRTHLL